MYFTRVVSTAIVLLWVFVYVGLCVHDIDLLSVILPLILQNSKCFTDNTSPISGLLEERKKTLH